MTLLLPVYLRLHFDGPRLRTNVIIKYPLIPFPIASCWHYFLEIGVFSGFLQALEIKIFFAT